MSLPVTTPLPVTMSGKWLAMAVVMACVVGIAEIRADEASLAIKANRVHVGNGRTVEGGVVLIQGGCIQAVGRDVTIPKQTPVIEIAGGSVTPGLIDANARVESADLIDVTRKRSVISEQSSEVVPHIRVLDDLNLRSSDFERLLRGGVTTVYASPDASSVIGPRGAILHTGGRRQDRVLSAAAAVKATIGSEPSSLGSSNRRPYGNSVSIYTRRPNSRSGLVWVFRKAFYDAIRRSEGLEAYGADTASPAASAVLREVLDGSVTPSNTVPLRIQARIQQDILTALRLASVSYGDTEFQLRFTLEEATEAYLCIDELKAASVPVIFGPIYEQPGGIRSRSGEGSHSRYHTLGSLLEAGIPTALSAQELREEDGLARQAMYAMRFGVGFQQALKAVTQTPARMLGLDDQLGTIEPGKRADLVIWSGRPFEATSMVMVVLIDGRVVVDRR